MSESKKGNRHKFIKAGLILGGIFTVAFLAAKKYAEPDSVDQENPYLRSDSCDPCRSITPCSKVSFYEKHVKPGLDKALSFAGLILLAPVCAVISIAIYLDDPGPVLFAQKRVGKDGHFFELHKFRTMKMDTPHDVPTHQLADPDQYITRVGGFLRKYSLDELPQVWDIFRGKMSIIGPRPALWNQADLIAEREKYDANSVMPGLTGWAQINGRDELEITDKAALDGEYVRRLRSGNVKGMLFDLKCFFGTVKSVAGSEGVVEGGTGTLQQDEATVEPDQAESGVVRQETQKREKTKQVWYLKQHVKKDVIPPVDPADAGFEDYGYKKEFHIDKNVAKKVLITGAGSYVGESFKNYAAEHYPNLTVDTVDMVDGSWRERDFSGYDSVFHVAGIAHADTGKVTEEEKKKYYEVNTDLAIETAEKCKAEGVKQFVLMSSMIVYGESAPYGKKKVIDEHTVPAPANFYGDSKWQADKGVRRLQDENFRVAVIRAPMIYGKGSKGNYPLLAKLAKKLPVFPDVENKRSMLYIGNLCEFVSLLVLSGEGGVYFPQNDEHVNTSELVRLIGGASGHKVRLVKWMRPLVAVAGCITGKIGRLVGKAFGNSVYQHNLSIYSEMGYDKADFAESVIETENNKKGEYGNATENSIRKAKHILVISQYFYPENFRINDIAQEWVKRGYKVTVLTGIPNYPEGKFYEGYGYRKRRKEQWNGMDIIRLPLIPRGNCSIGLVANYFSFVASGWFWNKITDIHADLVFTFEVSPMTQALIGCWYKKKYHVPHFLYVTDLWPENVKSVTRIRNEVILGLIQKMTDYIYKNADRIFTCSKSFINPIIKRGINKQKIEFWPQYAEDFYRPVKRHDELLPQDGIVNFVFAGNIGYAQGLHIFVETAKRLKNEQICVRFNIIGEGRYLHELKELVKTEKVSNYFSFIQKKPAEAIPKYFAFADAVLITLSKSDVFSITIPAKTQSCMACGKPILVSADGEVQDIIREAQAGLCSAAGDVDGFVKNIKLFLDMGEKERNALATNALVYSKKRFNKEKLLDRLDEIFKHNSKMGSIKADVSI